MLKKTASMLLSFCVMVAVLITPSVSLSVSAADFVEKENNPTKIVNTYDDDGIYYKSTSSDTLASTRRFTDNNLDVTEASSSLDYGVTYNNVFGFRAVTETDTSGNTYFKYSRINRPPSADPFSNIRIYNPYDNYALFAPEKNQTYKITLKYKQTQAYNYNNFQINLYGLTGKGVKTDFVSDNILVNIVTLFKTKTVNDWTEVTAYFAVGDIEYTSLAIVPEIVSADHGTNTNAPSGCYIDDVTVEECEKIVNTYDDAGIYYKATTSDTLACARRFTDNSLSVTDTSSSLDYGVTYNNVFGFRAVTETDTSGNTYFKYGRINRPPSADPFSNIRIYNPYDNYALFAPEKNQTYKITLKYKQTQAYNYSNFQINLYGLTGLGAKADFVEDNILVNIVTVLKTVTVNDWTEVTAYFAVGDIEYTSLAIVPEIVSADHGTNTYATSGCYIDDIMVEECTQIVNSYDDTGIYYKSTSSDTLANTRRFTDNTLDVTEEASTLDYGLTFGNVFAFRAVTETSEDGNTYFKYGRINRPPSADPFSNIRIYNPYDDYALFVPQKNTTYKITLKYKQTRFYQYSNFQINLYGLTGKGVKNDFVSENILVNLATIDRGTTVDDWTETTVYFNVGDVEYTSLAIVPEIVALDHGTNKYTDSGCYIDNIVLDAVYMPCDINEDGPINVIDLIRLKKIVAGTSCKADSADLDGNNAIDASDLTVLRKILLGSYKEVNVGDGAISSLRAAYAAVADGGKINIVGDYKVTDLIELNTNGKKVTISGGSLDLTAFNTVELVGDITFENLSLKVNDGSDIYASGYSVTIAESVNVIGTPAAIYGGTRSGYSAKTDLTVLSGNYSSIYGGGSLDKVGGNATLTVGGNANSNCDETSHSATYLIYGGSYSGTVNGDTEFNFCGNAKANYIYGGGYLAGSMVAGKCHLNISGAKSMSVFGGSRNGGVIYNTEVNMDSGWCCQIFGGSEHSGVTGSTELNLMGGNVQRRIYGGCYNGWTLDWDTDYFVNGTTNVTIGENFVYSGDYEQGDNSIVAGSRYSNNENEIASLYIETQSVYDSIKSNIGFALAEVAGFDALYIANVKQ